MTDNRQLLTTPYQEGLNPARISTAVADRQGTSNPDSFDLTGKLRLWADVILFATFVHKDITPDGERPRKVIMRAEEPMFLRLSVLLSLSIAAHAQTTPTFEAATRSLRVRDVRVRLQRNNRDVEHSVGK